jgi:hypothetical protein
MPEIDRDLVGDLGALDTAALPSAGKALVDPTGEPPARPPMIAGSAAICASSA